MCFHGFGVAAIDYVIDFNVLRLRFLEEENPGSRLSRSCRVAVRGCYS